MNLLLRLIPLVAMINLSPPRLAAPHLRATHEHTFTVALTLAEAFTFFEPVGEKRWAEGWQPQFATPADTPLHNGTVFTVERPNPHGGAPILSVWTITRYEPSRAIEYHNVIADVRATRITVICESAAPDRTNVTVRYVYTGLSESGDEAIRQTTPASFAAMIDSWGTMISAYLARGTPASP